MQASKNRCIPEIKILLYIAFTVSLFVWEDITVYLVLLAALSVLLLRIPFKTVRAGWLPICVFLLFTFLSNVFSRQGRVLFSWGDVLITREGVVIASLRTMRVLLMIMGAKILMASAKTEEVIDGLGRLLSPFQKLGLPVRDFFHTMGLTLKCFPLLKDMAAQTYNEKVKAVETGNFSERAKLASTFLMPLFVKSIQSPEIFFERSGKNEE